MKLIALLSVLITGGLLIFAAGDFPNWGDPYSPASTHLSPHYIEKSLGETSVPNFVTSLLADYRGYDTMFETSVVLTAGVAIFAILRRRKNQPLLPETAPPLAPNPIIHITTRLLMPIIQLFGLYVIAHGHHSPGGGFQGGVILGAGLILQAVSYNLQYALKGFSEKLTFLFANTGVLIYAGIGVLCLLLGSNFLDYAALQPVLLVDAIQARSLGILGVEIGVAMTVMSVMFAIYALLSSQGDMDEGI